MSGMLFILLSGLSLFGSILLDPQEMSNEEAEDPSPTPETPDEGGSNPLDIAVEDVAAGSADEAGDTDGATEGDTTGAGDDTASAGDEDVTENDTIAGSEQSDTIDAGAGDDVVDGRSGHDTISGGSGADNIEGSEGNDVIYGGDVESTEDSEEDTLSGGAGDDEIHLGDNDIATGGEGADSFVRQSTMTSRALVTDFDSSEDMIVIEHQSDTPPTLERQTLASDGVILEMSDGSRIELAGVGEPLDASLISFVDTRATPD